MTYRYNHLPGLIISTTIRSSFLWAVLQIVPLAGSVSDVELTHSSGVIEKLKGKQHISVTADCGFKIHDQLKLINVDLNIPPFMDEHAQLPADEVLEGR